MKNLEINRNGGFQTIKMDWSIENDGFQLETFNDLALALRHADSAPDISSTVLFGSPSCFCLGADVNAFIETQRLDELSDAAQRFFSQLISSRKPLIAAVDGTAVGLGMTMLLHFDAVFATHSSRFKAPFVEWGILPEAASSLLLPETLGYRKAFEVFFLGGELTAKEAEDHGLITRATDEQSLDGLALRCAHRLSKLPERSLTSTRELMRQQRSKLARRSKIETETFRQLLMENSTQRRIRAMARAKKMMPQRAAQS